MHRRLFFIGMKLIKLEGAKMVVAEARSLEEIKNFPTYSGLYFVYEGEELVYIGRAKNIRKRWIGHHRKKLFSDLKCVVCFMETECLGMEKDFISEFNPKYNFWKDCGDTDYNDPKVIKLYEVLNRIGEKSFPELFSELTGCNLKD